ncbi:MAG TPA: PBP1A family penicillin-binding protein [Vicinamibacteria bacterium]|jgi:penicillin-binding protein 1A|nr:PBP1A family penicillin-binding protein [Vicinamibacteria bacterium]
MSARPSSLPPPEPVPSAPAPPLPPRRARGDPLVLLLLGLQLAAGLLATGWIARHGFAIWRLTRGVGETIFYSADGRPWFPLDEHRREVPLDQISPHLQHAVIAIEDHRFYRHPGIDPLGVGRAVVHDVRGGREGASTISQQLARTLFLSNERTWTRKVKEAALALMLEELLSKDKILELYLNRIYLSGGMYGVETMARKLFVKHARDVNLAEAALIAGLIRAPSALSPWTNIDAAIERSEVVLRRMREEGFITEAQEREARRAKFRITAYPGLADTRAGYAKEFLRQSFRDIFGRENPADWEVHTTFLPAAQQAAEQAVAEGLQRLRVPGLQAALVALEPSSGDLLALVGGRDYNESSFNRAVRSRRQPGSAFKPFVYAAALERGYSPVSVLTHLGAVSAPGRQEWMPRNSGEVGPDEETLRQALLESNNQAAVALQQKIGTRAVLDLAGDLGLRGLPDVPSLALGTGEVTPFALTTAYAVFANGGLAVRPRAIVRTVDGEGSVAFETEPEARRVISEPAAFQALTMLRDVVDLGTGAPVRELGLRFPVAGKTGTTDDFKDAWFVGFSTAVVAGVWVGFDQPAPIHGNAYAARVALPIWTDFMRRAARALPPGDFAPPAGLEEHELCRVSYLRPVQACPTYVEYFKQHDEVPSRLCPIHQGTFKQDVRRAVEGLLGKLGRKLKDIFK